MPKLYPHQEDAIKKLSNGKILHGGTGSGKSLTSIAYYMRNEAPKNVYIITTAKKRDKLEWHKEAAKFGLGDRPDCTVAGIVTIDSWNNVPKYTEVSDCFFIFDEQRLVGNGAWVKAFQKIAKKNNWIVLTATPGDRWIDYAPIFIANNLYKNITEFRREHVVYEPYVKFPKIKTYINTDVLERYRSMLLVEMPYEKHTKPHDISVKVSYNEDALKEVSVKRWNPYTDSPIKNISELFHVVRRIVNSDVDRFNTIGELLQAHSKLIIFYNFDYELEILRGLSSVVRVAEWNGHKHEEVPETDSWAYLVQYTSGAEGWNCTSTDAIVFWSLNYSWKTMHQSKGRIDRLDTPFTDLYYYTLVSDSWIDKAILKALEAKETFNETAYMANSRYK